MADSERTAERERTRTRAPADVAVDPVDSVGVVEGDSHSPAASDGVRDRARARLASLFSLRQFIVGTVATVAGLLVVGGALPLGAIGDLLGVATGAFVHGAVAGDRRYAEAAAAGGAVGAVATVLDHLVLTVVTLGLPVAVFGATGGVVAGLVGHYFGRDLRDGLTREL